MSDYAGVTGRWGQRVAEPGALVQQLARCLTSLAEIDPLFVQWRRDGNRSQSKVPAFITMPPDIEELRAWVTENAEFHAVDGRKRKTVIG